MFPKIKSLDTTMDLLINSNKSLARYGDGELNMLDFYTIGFQKHDKKLSENLKRVLADKQSDCLIALPGPMINQKGLKKEAIVFWRRMVGNYYSKYQKYLDKERPYLNSFITRPYMDFINTTHVASHFVKFKKIWENKSLLFVEGEHSKLGLGNDLFSNAKSIRRIITLSKNAYSKYDEIIIKVKEIANKDEIIILALGPTATVLAFDLSSMGYRALDLGHIDIEYEWFLKNAQEKIAIKGKDVCEIDSYNTENVENERYYQQIVARIL